MGAKSVGLVVVAGLSYAVMSLCSKKSTIRPKEQLEHLKAQQEEVSLAFDDESHQVEEKEIETGIKEDLSSSTEFNGTSTENNLDNDDGTNLVDSFTSKGNANGATNTIPSEKDSQNTSASGGMSVDLDITPVLRELSESEVVSDLFVASALSESDKNLDIDLLKATSEVEDESTNVRETIDTNFSGPIKIDNDLDEGKFGSEGNVNSSVSVHSSSGSTLTNEPVIESLSVGSELEPISEPQSVPEDSLETVKSPATEEYFGSSRMSQLAVEVENPSLELNNLSECVSSETTSVSAPAHPLTNEESKCNYKDISSISVDSSSGSTLTNEPEIVSLSVGSELEPISEPQSVPEDSLETIKAPATEENFGSSRMSQFSVEIQNPSLELNNLSESVSSETNSVSAPAHHLTNEESKINYKDTSSISVDSSSGSTLTSEPVIEGLFVGSELKPISEPQSVPEDCLETIKSPATEEYFGSSRMSQFSVETKNPLLELKNLSESVSSETTSVSALAHPLTNEESKTYNKDISSISVDSSSGSTLTNEPVIVSLSVGSELEPISEPQSVPEDSLETTDSPATEEYFGSSRMSQFSVEIENPLLEPNNLSKSVSSETTSVSAPAHPLTNEESKTNYKDKNGCETVLESSIHKSSLSPAGIPAPSVVSAALRVHPVKVLVPAVVDQVQGQAFAVLQVLKVIEADAQPSELCTRRDYARWLVSASSILSRNTASKVYPAMYIENVTELAFDDITLEDPDFPPIQGLAETGLISSKLSNQDLLNDNLGPSYFFPESPLSRQDLVCWKMALEKRQLPEADRKILYQTSGFMDIDKINPDAWPAIMADLSAGEQGIIALAFGCTRLFQPNKPVTNAEAAVALATGEASDLVNEELARIEAESIAENAVSALNALVAQVEKDVNAIFEKELSVEREKINAVEEMAGEAKCELERLKAEREEENIALMMDHAAIDSEVEVLSMLRREVEEQLESLMSDRVEISYEKERISKLRIETEEESQEIVRLKHELEVERKALSMARAWAEDEAIRAREQANLLEEIRDRWESQGIKVVVANEIREHSVAGVKWVNAGEQVAVEGTINRGETLVSNLKLLVNEVRGKGREFINKIVQIIQYWISKLKEWTSKTVANARELKDRNPSISVHKSQQSTAGFSSAFKESAKRLAGHCQQRVEKLAQRFRA